MKFLIFPGNDDVFYKMFDEINDEVRYPNIKVRKEIYWRYNDNIINFRNKLSYHVLLNGKLNDLYDDMTSFFSKIRRLEKKVKEKTCFVFSNITFRTLPNYIIKRLKNNKYINIVVYMLDSSSQKLCKEAVEKCLKYKIKFVYTFDKVDAEKYGFYHFYYIYSKLTNEMKPVNTDVMFFGSDKGRLRELLHISEEFEEENISSKMYIVGVDNEVQKSEKVIINEPIPYVEMIKKLQKTKCILDYVIEDQVGLSYRPMEAICYNKKLLTNNKSILDFPYYNAEFMQYFKNSDEIDMSFLKKNIAVDYKYKGEYSPKNFIQRIESDIENGESIHE